MIHIYRRLTGRYCRWYCPRCARKVRDEANRGR